MIPESCFGIDIVDDRWLVVAQRQDGKSVPCKRFDNTTDGFASLLKFIRDTAAKPKVCIKSAGRTALTIALRLCGIPQAEVILLSHDGLQQIKSRAQSIGTKISEADHMVAAEILARCAERMI